MATSEGQLCDKLESALAIAKDDAETDTTSGEGIYTSELRGSDESGEGTYKVPYKTIMQAMRRHGKEPFPIIYQDSKPDSDAAKSGKREMGSVQSISLGNFVESQVKLEALTPYVPGIIMFVHY